MQELLTGVTTQNYLVFKAELGVNFSRNKIFSDFQLKTSFCQLSNMASSGLKKMLTFIILCAMFGKILFFTIFNTNTLHLSVENCEE